MPKALTYEQVAERKRRAEEFLRTVKEDDERADEVAEDYAERRHFEIIDNSPRRRNQKMADNRTRQDLLDQIGDLQDENDSLQSQLDAISDILDVDDDDGDDDNDQ